MPFNNYNPVLEGITTAMDIAGRIRNAALQQEQLKRMEQQSELQKEEFAWRQKQQEYLNKRQGEQDQLNQANLRMRMLESGIHPAQPGDIAEATAQRFRMDEAGNQTPTGQTGTSIVNRMFDYGGQKMVIPSREESIDEQMRTTKLLGDAATVAAIDKARKLQEATAEEVPPAVADAFGIPRGTRVAKDILDNMVTSAMQSDRDRLNRQSREDIAAKNRASAERRAAARTAAGGMTPGQSAVQARFDQREMDKDIETADKLQEKEQATHTLRETLGSAMGVKDREAVLDPKTGREEVMTPLYRARLKAQLKQATTDVENLQKRQKAIRQKWGFGEFAKGGPKTGRVLADPLGIR